MILQTLGSTGDRQAKIDVQTSKQLEEIGKNVQINAEAAIQKLLAIVCDIKPDLHTNYRVDWTTASTINQSQVDCQ